MTFEIKENQIFLFKNDVPEGSNKPPFKGSLMVGGVKYEIALWGSKSGKDGSYSGKVSLPYKAADTHKGFDKQGDIPAGNIADIDTIPF